MQLHHVRRGGGEPLLLIQGMGGTHLSWGEPFLSELERDFDLVTFDNRGVGRSDRVDGPFTIGDMADDAAALMDEIGWQSSHVLGISMGGMIAQELVLRHAQRVRTLALGCTYSGGPGSSLGSEEVNNRLGPAWASGDRELAIRTTYEINTSPGFRADESTYAAFREMALAVPVPLTMIMLQAQAVVGHDTSARLGSIAASTLVMHGDADEVIDVANGRLVASLIPGSRLEVLEGAGHMFWWERPERSAALVREHALAGARR